MAHIQLLMRLATRGNVGLLLAPVTVTVGTVGYWAEQWLTSEETVREAQVGAEPAWKAREERELAALRGSKGG